MRIGILGDVHGNKDALNAVLQSAEKCKVERLLITGDLVGYYPYAKEVLSLLSNWQTDSVRGNHEDMLVRSINDPKYLESVNEKYGFGLKESLVSLSKAEIRYLTELPHPLKIEIEKNIVLIAHGSPADINEYMYPDTDLLALKWVSQLDCDILFCGHSHYPMQKHFRNKLIINPGSVGQPRNKGSSAHWVLWNTELDSFEFKTEEYELAELIHWAKSTNPKFTYLHEVFTR